MDSLFNLLTSIDSLVIALLIIALTFVISLVYTFIISFKLRSSKSFFLNSLFTPMIVSSVIVMVSLFLNESTSGAVRIATIAVALGLIRFRSAPGKAEELLLLFGGVAIGLISGLGYVLLAFIIALSISILFVIFSSINIFSRKRFSEEKLLKVTIPEDLDYQDALNPILNKYLKTNELVGIKTAGMGSLYRLSYKVELVSSNQEKAFIDELRTKNSNLEISLLPFVEDNKSL